MLRTYIVALAPVIAIVLGIVLHFCINTPRKYRRPL